MKERPILFSGPMVRAIPDGRKTQTRRVMKPQPEENGIAVDGETGEIACYDDSLAPSDFIWRGEPRFNWAAFCPYGQPGDLLWVRETWQTTTGDPAPSLEEELSEVPRVRYYADDNPRYRDKDKWRPSIFMPKWACRLRLRVTDVRVERLQDMNAADAVAEGIDVPRWDVGDVLTHGLLDGKRLFADLWDSLNAKRGFGWDVNPWVWVISFEQIEQTL